MRFSLTIFCILFALIVRADYGHKELNGFDPHTDYIADNYQAGPFLIYDCEENHWTCVMESFHKECETRRDRDVGDARKRLRCAPFGDQGNKKSCFQKQLFLVGQNSGDRFCVGKNWKEKEIRY